ncbi:hypothetical protein R1sor_012076 [Riccia sorocarpa]|uniref:Uncharacterized protein n=1 Tax=Riccia sorocarpa TaxID=122646 RepID=A0ABD3I6K5_9MARC
MKEDKLNVSEAESFRKKARSFHSGKEGRISSSSAGTVENFQMDDPQAGGMDSELEERSQDLSTRNDVAAVHKQPTDNHEFDAREDESDSKSPPPKKKTKMVSFRRLVSHRDFLDSSLMVAGTLGAIAAGVSQPLLTVLFGSLVDALDPRKPVSNSTAPVNSLCLKLLYTALGCGFGSFLEMAGWTISAERQAIRLRSMYLKALLRQDVGFYDQEVGVGEAINKISGDILLIQDAMGDKVASVIELTTRFFFGFGVGFYTSWKMTLVTIAALPPIAIVGSLMAVSLTKASNRVQDAYSKAGVTVEQALGSIRTIASNTGEKRAMETYDNALEKAEKAGAKLGLTNGLGLGAVFFTTFSAYGLAMWYGSRLVADGEATAGEIIRTLFSVVMGGSSLGLVVPFLTGILAGLGAGYSMFQIIDRKPPIDSENLGGETIPSVKGEIQLKNVYFAYPTRPEFPVFTDFSLLIQAGSTTALVGESGSGKSSVIQLIERFYDPQDGQVLLDGVDIRELQLKWLRSQIALVSQEPVLFATSIRENIRYGKEDATQEEIESACVLANAALFIDRMPEGYDTLVGDRGIQLSGGQKQRVAIARAILKSPRILLLDEATSALDAESEHIVQEALDRLSTRQTTVVIAHRLSTIKNASLIAVVQNGTIVETGVHEELSQNPASAYSQLIRFQEISKTESSEPESNMEISNWRTDGASGRSDGGSFRKPSNRSFRDSSSRRLAARSHSRRGSSSRFSFVSDILSISQRVSSKHFDATQVHDLLDTDVELGKEDMPEEDILAKQKVSLTRLAGMNKPELPFLLLGAVGAAGAGAILPVFAFCLDKSIVALQEVQPSTVRHDGGFYALLFVALAGAHILFTPCEKISFAYAGERLLRRLRLKSFEKILRQEVSWFDEDRNSSAILSSKLLADAAVVRGVVSDAVCTTVEAVSTLIVGFSIAFSASWELALVILGISPFLAMQAVLTISMEHQPSKTDQNNVNQAAQVASDAVSNIRTVASFCAEEKIVQLYAKKLKAASIANIRKGLLNGFTYGIANFCLFCGYAIAFYAGAKFALQGRVKINEVFLVILTMALSALSLANALRKVPELARCKPAIRSIFALLDQNSKVDPLDDNGVSLKSLRGRIDFQAVTFRYPTRPTVLVLQGLSFTLRSGTTLALVGGSGSGKSTVISLIERFYDPLSGSILIDGVEIQALNITWLRQNIGLVSQEPVLFDDTIRGNILHGKEGSTTEDEIHEAARFANAHTFISALPDGYSTRVGERGVQLSGGQKQRVAIARAILKNPKILLLDEATSALDAESEHVVQEALDRVMVQRSTIIVAHRLSTVRNAQQILVLKSGNIAEKGTYSELISAGGLFASLARQTFTRAV